MIETLLAACLVIGVPDGDSLKVTCPDRKAALSIRLQGIDAPEIAHPGLHIAEQPYGRESKAALTALCLSTHAHVTLISLDRYQRHIAKVRCGEVAVPYPKYTMTLPGIDASTYQVEHGNAWSYLAPRRSTLPAAMATAQQRHLGLWALPNPIKPSVWRHGAPQ
jgi:endonuclease YncB( thermonuclease family)